MQFGAVLAREGHVSRAPVCLLDMALQYELLADELKARIVAILRERR